MKSNLMSLAFLLFSIVVNADREIPLCSPNCSLGQICLHKDQQSGICKNVPTPAPLENLRLPFESNEVAYCTHSSGSGSHSWTNAFFALDLATAYEQPAAKILAAADGKAFVFFGEDGLPCPEPKGTAAKAGSSQCGLAWGNHIKILHSGGYYSFYVHLDRILVKNGEEVKKGQVIGIEGWTGAAGHRHLHWSVQKLPCSLATDCEKKISSDGESVPFHFAALVNGQKTIVDTSNFHCAHASVGQAGPKDQPKLQAIEE